MKWVRNHRASRVWADDAPGSGEGLALLDSLGQMDVLEEAESPQPVHLAERERGPLGRAYEKPQDAERMPGTAQSRATLARDLPESLGLYESDDSHADFAR